MQNKLIITLLAVLLVWTSVVIPTYAVSNQQINSKRQEINAVNNKQAKVNQQISGKQNNINKLQAQQKNVQKEIRRLDFAVAETAGNVRQKRNDIYVTTTKINDLQEKIKIVKARIAKRNELLAQRMQSLQVTGGVVNYLDVVLGAQSFGDFISRVDAVTTIFEADKEILREHERDQKKKERSEAQLQDKKETQQKQLAQLKQLEETLRSQVQQKQVLMATLQKKEEEEHAEMLDLQEESAVLAAQEAAIRRQVSMLEELKRREEEAARNRENNSGNNGGNNGGGDDNGGTLPPVSGGSFTRPAAGPITSGFGPRWGRMHYGVDIGKRGSSVPVVAAASGIVFQSYYSSSYGNVIFVTHNINGQLFTTVYAHLESRQVGEGTLVTKGQLIGYMGNTGDSQGAHLHFELHRGPWNNAKSNAINPMQYVPF